MLHAAVTDAPIVSYAYRYSSKRKGRCVSAQFAWMVWAPSALRQGDCYLLHQRALM